MPLAAQGKLLRVLQEGEVEPLGGGRIVNVQIRVIAATHRDLKQRVEEDLFREDLLFRLRVVELHMPPLRERGDDVLLLARRFLETFSNRPLGLDPRTEQLLVDYRWPGNVRELRNAVERAAIFCRGATVRPDDLPKECQEDSGEPRDQTAERYRWDGEDDFQAAKTKVIDRFEREILCAALSEHQGNISHAARALGLHRQNVQQKLRRLGISAEDFKGE